MAKKTTKQNKSAKASVKKHSSKVCHEVKKTEKIVKTGSSANDVMMSWVRATTEAIENFDFELCAEYYRKLDWKWCRDLDSKSMTLPDEHAIREEVSRMINTCIKGVVEEKDVQTSYMCSTGGLAVRAFKYENPDDNWIWIGFCPVETMY